MAERCPLCDNTGYRPIDPENRAAGVIPCDHRRNAAGFESVGTILRKSEVGSRKWEVGDAALTPNDKKIAEILQAHVGKKNPIRSAELAGLVFDPSGEADADPKRKEEFRRNVTQSIERLRTFARLPIAATKEPPYGYFLAETQEEWDDMHERYMRELVRVAKLARLFRPQADIVQRLRGQLALAGDQPGSSLVTCPPRRASHSSLEQPEAR